MWLREERYLRDFGGGSDDEAVISLNLLDQFLLGELGFLDGLDAVFLQNLDAFLVHFVADQNPLQFQSHRDNRREQRCDNRKQERRDKRRRDNRQQERRDNREEKRRPRRKDLREKKEPLILVSLHFSGFVLFYFFYFFSNFMISSLGNNGYAKYIPHVWKNDVAELRSRFHLFKQAPGRPSIQDSGHSKTA